MTKRNLMICLLCLIGLVSVASVSADGHVWNGSFQPPYNVLGVHKPLGFLFVVMCILFLVLLVLLVLVTSKTKQRIKEEKMVDSETGIGNLAFFEQWFHSVSHEMRSKYYIAYLIIDSNYLQVYHGESVFSESVNYVASVLSAVVSERETVARITENGFVFTLECDSDSEAETRFEKTVAKLSDYIENNKNSDNSYFRAVLYHLNEADTNCEFALFNLRKHCNKLFGREEQYTICSPDILKAAVEEKKLLDSIDNGFKNKEFKLYIQFIIDNKTKKIVSAEALSRWENPDRGLLTPGHYLETMENSGTISQLDYYMFEMACRQLHKWRGTDFDSLTLSCNFTRITLSDDDFLEKIKEITQKYIFDPSRLVIEITEEAMEKNRQRAVNNILECKKLGFKIALDDLGCGYTSLINLCEYPIDIVKLDREILLKAEKVKGKKLFDGIVSLAHSLGLTVVCEGVENDKQEKVVSETDCDYIQGWFYSLVYPVLEGETFARAYSQN